MESTTPGRPRAGAGFACGLATGVAVWIAYFILASRDSDLFWDVFVVPILAALFIGALVLAAFSSRRSRWWIGFAFGAAAMFPIAMAIALAIWEIYDLE